MSMFVDKILCRNLHFKVCGSCAVSQAAGWPFIQLANDGTYKVLHVLCRFQRLKNADFLLFSVINIPLNLTPSAFRLLVKQNEQFEVTPWASRTCEEHFFFTILERFIESSIN